MFVKCYVCFVKLYLLSIRDRSRIDPRSILDRSRPMDPWTASVGNMMQTHAISIGKVSSCQLMRFHNDTKYYNLKRKGAAEQRNHTLDELHSIPCDLIKGILSQIPYTTSLLAG